ncbi:MAG: hypothetical protein KGL04_00595 [Elusimicrobia bacterium]|nr:hypothetical protein [Elusimicrobiota bacterium]
MKKFFNIGFFFALLCAPAFAYYTPRNPHYHESTRKKSGARKKKSGAAAPGSGQNRAAPDVLGPGGWTSSVRRAVDELIADKGFSSRGYDAQKPPVAVLSWEGVFYVHDAAGQVFLQMVRSARFKFGDEFWSQVPIAYGRRKIRAAYEQFSILPMNIWEDEPTYLQYRKYFVESYRNQCEDESWSKCRAFLSRLFAGFTPQEARDYAATVINSELQQPLGQEVFSAGPQDARPLKIQSGLRVVPEAQGLVAALLKAGFDVWVMDEDPQPVLEAEAAPAGISAARVVGIRTKIVRGVLTGDIEGDVPARGAKTAAAIAAFGRAPDLVVGASSDDASLLGYGKGVRVLIDHGDKKLDAKARREGWLLQPAFGP